MSKKYLGKIVTARWGKFDPQKINQPLGLHLSFQFEGISRVDRVVYNVDMIKEYLVQSDKQFIDQLVGIPVELEFTDNDLFHQFRILTEVL